MAETHHIADMAADLARKLFTAFYWEEIKPSDQNWKCVKIKEHNKEHSKTHPSDAVYRFIHPYTGNPTYIVFDYKSLADKSIQPGLIGGALRSLAMTLDCAMVSDEWQKLYLKDSSFDIQGSLFVYNHDGNYKKLLSSQVDSNLSSNFPTHWPKLQKHHEITVADPETITFLYSIYKDLACLTGEEKIPKPKFRGFYQPDKQLKYHKLACSKHYEVPLMPDQLSSETIFIRYKDERAEESGKSGFIIYYRGTGETVDEFIYLLDSLFTYQIIDNSSQIMLRLCLANKFAQINFEKAKDQYSHLVSGTDSIANLIRERLSIITFESFDLTTPTYLETEQGMKS